MKVTPIYDDGDRSNDSSVYYYEDANRSAIVSR